MFDNFDSKKKSLKGFAPFFDLIMEYRILGHKPLVLKPQVGIFTLATSCNSLFE